MKNILFGLFFVISSKVSAQHYHKCISYYQNREHYAQDKKKHLEKVQYFNGRGKIVKEEDFRYVYLGDLLFDSVPRGWCTYYYVHDTLLISSLYCHYRGDTTVIVDTNQTRYYYDKRGYLEVDSSFYFGENHCLSYDLLYQFIAKDTVVNRYFYDDLGRIKVKLNSDLVYSPDSEKLGHEKRETFEYDSIGRMIKSSLSYSFNCNKNPYLPDVGDFFYKYDDGLLVEKKHCYNNKEDTICGSEKYTYEFDSHGIITEVTNRKRKRENYEKVEYGYFPDKRKIKEIKNVNIETYKYD